MPQTILRIDGQERPIDASLVTSNDNYAKLRKLMTRIFPLIGNASISHKQEGDKTVVTVVKRADQKGRRKPAVNPAHTLDEGRESRQSAAIRMITDRLEESQPEENPALVLACSLKMKLAGGQITLTELKRRRKGIDRVIKAGEDESKRVTSIVNKLDAAEPVPSEVVPTGF